MMGTKVLRSFSPLPRNISLKDLVPLAGVGPPGHRRRQIRDQGDLGGRGGGVHTRLRLDGGLRGQ